MLVKLPSSAKLLENAFASATFHAATCSAIIARIRASSAADFWPAGIAKDAVITIERKIVLNSGSLFGVQCTSCTSPSKPLGLQPGKAVFRDLSPSAIDGQRVPAASKLLQLCHCGRLAIGFEGAPHEQRRDRVVI